MVEEQKEEEEEEHIKMEADKVLSRRYKLMYNNYSKCYIFAKRQTKFVRVIIIIVKRQTITIITLRPA